MDQLFRDAVDAIVNEQLRVNASEQTREGHPVDNVETAQPSMEDAPLSEAVPQGTPIGDGSTWFENLFGGDSAGGLENPMGVPEGIDGAQYIPGTQPSADMKLTPQVDGGEAENMVTGLPGAIQEGAVLGPALAIGQLRDTIAGTIGEDTDPANRSDLRKGFDKAYGELKVRSLPGAMAANISQFLTGLYGAGKLLSPIQATGKTKAAKTLVEGFAAGFAVMDPHEQRLSNLIQEFPALENPISEYLAMNPDDTAMEGRLKNGLEGLGLDLAASAAVVAGLRAIRYARSGNPEAATEVIREIGKDQTMEQVLAELSDMGKMLEPKQDPGVREVLPGEKLRVRVPANSETVPLEGGKPKVRVKAGSEQVPMVGTEASPGKLADDAVVADPQRNVTIEQAGDVFEAPPQPIKETVTPQDAEDIVRATEFDLQALDQVFWNRGDAFIQSGGTTGKLNNTIPWQKLQTTEDMAELVSNVVDVLGAPTRKVSDADVKRRVKKMADFWESDPNTVMADIVKGGKEADKSVQRMEGAYLLANRAFMDAHKVFQDITLQRFADYGGDKAGAVLEMRRRLNIAYQLYAAGRKMTASAGRDLRRMRSEFAVDPKVLESLKGLDDEQILRAVETTGGDPAKLRDMANPGFMRRLMDEAQFSMRNGLLWNYPTHIVNLVGNGYMQLARPVEKQLGSLVQSVFGFGKGQSSEIRKKATKELGYLWSNLGDGWAAAVEAAKKGDSKLAPHQTDWLNSQDGVSTAHVDLSKGNPFTKIVDFGTLAHNAHAAYNVATGLPTRMLGAQDEFFKTIAYRSVVQARAWVDGMDNGLQGVDLQDYIKTRLKESYDSEGRAIDKDALLEAQTRTFNQELLPGTFGFGLRNLRASVPALGFILPFVKTPINVLRYAHKYTPALNMLQKEARLMLMGKMGPEAQAQAIGQNMLGTLFMGVSGMMAANGMVTGGGPKDPVLRSQLIADGWKPYSFKFTNKETGETTYVPFGRLDPVGLPMGIMADLYEVWNADPDNEDLEDAVTATGIALAKNFRERTFLLNMNQAITALSGDEAESMEKWIGNTLRSIVPGSSALRGYVNQDPYLRDARNLIDRMLVDIPGYSERLPVRRDAVFGTPLTKRLGLTSNAKWDAVEAEINRITLETGEGFSPPDPERSGVDLRDLYLADGKTSAYDRLQELGGTIKLKGKTLHDSLADMIGEEDYQILADGNIGTKGTKLNALSGVVQLYRAEALKALVKENPKLALELKRRQIEAGAKVEVNHGSPGGFNDLLKQLKGGQ